MNILLECFINALSSRRYNERYTVEWEAFREILKKYKNQIDPECVFDESDWEDFSSAYWSIIYTKAIGVYRNDAIEQLSKKLPFLIAGGVWLASSEYSDNVLKSEDNVHADFVFREKHIERFKILEGLRKFSVEDKISMLAIANQLSRRIYGIPDAEPCTTLRGKLVAEINGSGLIIDLNLRAWYYEGHSESDIVLFPEGKSLFIPHANDTEASWMNAVKFWRATLTKEGTKVPKIAIGYEYIPPLSSDLKHLRGPSYGAMFNIMLGRVLADVILNNNCESGKQMPLVVIC